MLIHSNHNQNSSRKTFRIIATALLILSATLILLIFSGKIARSDPTLSKDTNTQTTQANLPSRLKIPSIGVDTTIYYVGLTPDGAMDVDKQDIKQVAWYQPGTHPGDIGSAVIAGHYGWLGSGESAVFNNLHNLNKNDEIIVIDNQGVSTIFIFRESRKYDPEANANDVFKSNDNKAHLNLITCYGDWVSSKNTYSDRLVVFADKK